jgi:class 3 adenylate cyclase/tetratricopeptide (TPR) repeat protein
VDSEQLEAAIAAQERLRGVVADEIIDATIALLRQQFSALGAGQRRRQVTVLFADVSGFTAMSERMDAERITAVMNDIWGHLDAVVLNHGGRIDKHIGDALMALWGADTTREDDPDRAVRAAFQMQEALAQFRIESGLEVAMRIGVNTGPVLLGGVGSTGEFTAMGDAVNVASRLEQASPKDGVLISHDTYRHVRGVFDVQRREALTVKGKALPLQAYVVLGVKERAFRVPSRGVEGVETRMVGRSAELSILCEAFETAAMEPGARLVTVVGEAGVGKSRLLYEFDNWLELHPRAVLYFKGRAVPHRRGVPLALFRDVVSSRFDIADSDPPEVVYDKLVRGTARALQPHDAAVLATWLGFDLSVVRDVTVALEGERLALAGRTHLIELIRAFTMEAPVVMLLEDIHWADDDSLGLATHLLAAVADSPILLVAAARPELVEDRPHWDAEVGRSMRIQLDALAPEDSKALVAEMLRNVLDLPALLIDLVVARSDGNPFYAEELVKMLIDDGVIDTAGPDREWLVDVARLDDVRVPATLTGVLQARLDALPSAVRVSLQRASVVGRIFWDDAVAALIGDAPALGLALDRELVFSRLPSSFTGCSEFIFKHALLRDVTYETVLLSERPALHARAAAWLEHIAANRREEYLAEIGGHYSLAGEHHTAAELFFAAAKGARRSGAARAARLLLEDALAAWRQASLAPPPAALVLLSECLWRLGDVGPAEDAARRAMVAARAIEDDVQLCEALYRASSAAEMRGDDGLCRDLIIEALPVAERIGGATLAGILGGLAWSDYRRGAMDEAEHAASLALTTLGASLDHSAIAGDAHSILGLIANRRRDFETSRRHNEESLAVARRAGDLGSESAALGNLGVFWHELGYAEGRPDYYERAEQTYDAALALARRLELRPSAAQVLSNMGELGLRRGRLDVAQQRLLEAIDLSYKIESLSICVSAIMHFGELLVAQGHVDAGLRLIGFTANHPAIGESRFELDHILERLEAAGIRNARRAIDTAEWPDLSTVVRELLANGA